jgi:hypothetical protein
MLDEMCVTTVLARYFPMARRADLNDAARDLMLLDLLSDDRLPVWEDSLRDRQDPSLAQLFAASTWRES